MNKHEFYFAWLQTVLHGLPRFKKSTLLQMAYPKLNVIGNIIVIIQSGMQKWTAVIGDQPRQISKRNQCLESHKNGISIVWKFKVKFGIFEK